jgi:hypothetical protein
MARDLLKRYMWLIDTIKRYGRITRSELDECWMRSEFSNGEKLPRRTFYNYRAAVEELFSINIECDTSTFEYYIASEDAHSESVTNWVLDSAVMNDVLSSARDIADKIFIEEVPSAREFLSPIIDAIRNNQTIKFTYHPYTRSMATPDVLVEPYFLKRFKQRWYITGRHVQAEKVKTYALDRMSELKLQTEKFVPDPNFDAETYFKDSFGIVFTQNEVKSITLKVDSHQAKYFRALPLHHSQLEMVHDAYSIFKYKMRITPDFVEEILSHGPRVTVLTPPELRAMVLTELQGALDNYKEAGQ